MAAIAIRSLLSGLGGLLRFVAFIAKNRRAVARPELTLD